MLFSICLISDSESEEELDGDNMQKNPSVIAGNVLKKAAALPKNILDIKQLKNCHISKSAGSISSIHFHPHANVLLATGHHKNMDVFQVYRYKEHVHYHVYIHHMYVL